MHICSSINKSFLCVTTHSLYFKSFPKITKSVDAPNFFRIKLQSSFTKRALALAFGFHADCVREQKIGIDAIGDLDSCI